MSTQPPLFPSAAPEPPPGFDFESASALPAGVLFGGSSWVYPGWRGIVYQQHYRSERDFSRRALEEYCRFPWFRTVGIDSSLYSPLTAAQLQHYHGQVPAGFRWVSKVWEQITLPVFPKIPRHGKVAGERNPHFLDSTLFLERVLSPYREHEDFRSHAGPFVFQFPAMSAAVREAVQFEHRLARFLESLPRDFNYAVEVRNRELLTTRHFQLLNSCGATHCFNHWNTMPSLIEQMKAAASAGGLSAPFYVARILTPSGVSYEEAVTRFKPYDRIGQPNQQMRADVVRLAMRALERQAQAFILVNNRAEGHSPGSIDAIGRMVVARLHESGGSEAE